MNEADKIGPEALSIWSQFGLAGLVIGALFCCLFYFIKSHREERKEDREFQTTIRQEQHTTIVKSFDGLTVVIKELSGAVRDLEKTNQQK